MTVTEQGRPNPRGEAMVAQGRLAGTATGELMTYALPGPAGG